MGKWGSGKKNKICKVCLTEFKARRDRSGLFCSRKCQTKGREKRPLNLIKCICLECGFPYKVKSYRKGTTKYCSNAFRSKNTPKGLNHGKWKGGISTRTWASRKIIRDTKKLINKCQQCGTDSNLQGHHVKGYYNDPNDVVILCINCHAKEHIKLKGFIKSKIKNKFLA